MNGIMSSVAGPMATPSGGIPRSLEKHNGDEPAMEAEGNPAYQAAMEVVMQALYKQGGAKDVARAVRSGDPVQALADTAYQIVQAADERTHGDVPDELLASLASDVVTEVAEVAHAAGVRIDGTVISKAMQLMIVRFLRDQGVDPSQVQQAMGQLDSQANVGQVLDQASQHKE